MNKIEGKAKVLRVEIPDYIFDSNESNERLDVKLTFRYESDVKGAKNTDFAALGIDSDLLELCEKATQRNDYSYLLDATRLGYKPGDDNKAEKELQQKLEGKTLYFTTYSFTISDLLKDTDFEGATAVNNEERNYTSFNSSYLGKYDDESAVFDGMQANLLTSLKNNVYRVGRIGAKEDKKEDTQQNRRNRRR